MLPVDGVSVAVCFLDLAGLLPMAIVVFNERSCTSYNLSGGSPFKGIVSILYLLVTAVDGEDNFLYKGLVSDSAQRNS